MVTATCRECGKEVSVGARTCSNCGAPAPAVSRRSRRMTTIVATVLILAAVGMCVAASP